MRQIRELIIRFLAAYLLVGLVYALSGYAMRAFQGKPEVFSSVLGIPVSTVSWPWMFRATWINFGWSPELLLTFGALIIATFVILAGFWRRQRQARHA